jgi:hypothetical protein
MPTAAEKRTEKAEAIERLREWIRPGDTLYTVMRHRAASGMSRSIDVYGFTLDPNDAENVSRKNAHLVKSWYSYNIVKAGIGSWDDKHEAVRVGGAGMDMGFHIVYELGCVLFPDGFGCIGQGCTSNDHSNADRDYTPHMDEAERMGADGTLCACHATHWHNNGGYALKQEWIG